MNILKTIAALFVAAFQALTGKKDEVIVTLPSVAITPEQLDQCIHIVNEVKAVLDSPAAIILTDLIPGTIDNVIRGKASAAIPDIVIGITLAKNWAGDNVDKEALTLAVLENVRFSADVDKNAFYHLLASRLIMAVSDGKVTWSEAVSIIEIYFKTLFISPLKTA